MQDQEGLTNIFYDLLAKLNSIEGLVRTFNRLDIMTEVEMRVIYHNSHSKCIEQMRKS